MNRGSKWIMVGAGAAVAGMFVGRAVLRRRRWFEWNNRVVVVTGGTRGLGLVLARRLIDRGAHVAICARTANDVTEAESELRRRGGRVVARTCDVTDGEQVREFVKTVQNEFGRIDVLINNAGIIQVGPLESMTDQDFQSAMATHCWGVLNMVRAVVPDMKSRGWGRIVNVASLGGKRAVPHMLPYAASKFALVGLSTGLRAELAKHGVLVTTVCPGLMRTGSPRNATFKGQHRAEYAWFSIGDSLPLISMPADVAAGKILTACQRGDAEVNIVGPLNLSAAVARLAPNLATEVLTLMDRLLPENGGIGTGAAKGFESHSPWSPSPLTMLGDRAAIENNEV